MKCMDEDYKSALQYADGYQKQIYEEEAKTIDDIQKGILEISNKEEPFDVFICYKETDANGRRTQDSVLANDLYHQLTQEGFKVFFSRITLEDKLGVAYEPYIFAALNSSKVMVVIGTKPEYFNAVWVKNEWSRYLLLVKNSGGKKILIPAYKDMDPYDLPEEFSHLQAQDMSKLGFMQDLIRGIKKIINSGEKETIKESFSTNGTNIEATIERAFLLIEDGENSKADEILENALLSQPKNPRIYVAKLLIELGIKHIEELHSSTQDFSGSPNFEKAIRFSNEEQKNKLLDYQNKALENIESTKKETIYNEASMLFIADTEEELLESQKLFESISDYKDSLDLAKQAGEKAETVRKDSIYENASDLLNKSSFDKISDYNKAIEKFTSIKDYKDSEDKIDLCERRIVEEKNRIAARKKRNKLITAITVPFVCIVIGVLIVYFTVVLPKQNYKKAEDLFATAKYSEAYDLYAKLGDYNDSADKANECLYIQATNFRNEKNWDSANELFEQIKDYKDSKDLLHYHDFKETGSKATTCTEEGYKDYACSCGETKHEVITALGHNYSAATCTSPQKCSRCGVTSGSALGHTTGGTTCSRCGANTFKTLTYSGRGVQILRNINLPEGNYLVTCSFSSKQSHIDIKLFHGSTYELVLNNSGENGSEKNFFNGSISNGYIQVETTNDDCNWKITIEAQ